MQRRPGSFPSSGGGGVGNGGAGNGGAGNGGAGNGGTGNGGPGNDTTSGGLLSPKSAENLGLKLVNLILEDNSPSVKELETRLKTVKLNYVSLSSFD